MSEPVLALTPELIIRAYCQGLFPMADSAEATEFHWVDPRRRGIIPLDGFHVPRSLKKTVKRGVFVIRRDTAFAAVIDGCAQANPGRDGTWINRAIRDVFVQLHGFGLAHSVECWRDGVLAGGLYGLALGGAFFGESMFSRATDASKVALVHLVARLKAGGFRLLDTQFVNDHLVQFGVVEIPRADYHARLAAALTAEADFYRCDRDPPLRQSSTQTS